MICNNVAIFIIRAWHILSYSPQLLTAVTLVLPQMVNAVSPVQPTTL